MKIRVVHNFQNILWYKGFSGSDCITNWLNFGVIIFLGVFRISLSSIIIPKNLMSVVLGICLSS